MFLIVFTGKLKPLQSEKNNIFHTNLRQIILTDVLNINKSKSKEFQGLYRIKVRAEIVNFVFKNEKDTTGESSKLFSAPGF